MKRYKDPIPLSWAIFLLVAGIVLGSVFTFGVRHWNSTVDREDCTLIETRFLSYDEIRRLHRPMSIKEIAIDCANDQRYFIDGVSINQELRDALASLSAHEKIVLLIHPNSNTIVEFTAKNTTLLEFETTIVKLADEGTGFLFLGIFMFFGALVGLYYIAWHGIRKAKLHFRRRMPNLISSQSGKNRERL